MTSYNLEKRVSRDYYKYQYNSWTTPTLTANGTLGGTSYAVTSANQYSSEAAYKAFDKNNSTQYTTNGNTGTLTFYSPLPLNVTKIKIRNGYASGYIRPISSIGVYGSNDNTTYIKLRNIDYTNTNKTVSSEWEFSLDSYTGGYKYIRFNTTGDGSYARITEMTITATSVEIINGTESDYDYYIDTNKTYGLYNSGKSYGLIRK